MESVKISQLQELSNVDSNTVVPVVSNGQNYKASVQSIMGDNLKTINNISILGNGNIEVNSLPDGGTVGQVLKKTSTGTEWADDKDTIPTWDTLSGKPSNATQDEDGLMSSADKIKLDGLQNYNNATSSTSGLMSHQDKTKLDSMRTDATNVQYQSKIQEGVNMVLLQLTVHLQNYTHLLTKELQKILTQLIILLTATMVHSL